VFAHTHYFAFPFFPSPPFAFPYFPYKGSLLHFPPSYLVPSIFQITFFFSRRQKKACSTFPPFRFLFFLPDPRLPSRWFCRCGVPSFPAFSNFPCPSHVPCRPCAQHFSFFFSFLPPVVIIFRAVLFCHLMSRFPSWPSLVRSPFFPTQVKLFFLAFCAPRGTFFSCMIFFPPLIGLLVGDPPPFFVFPFPVIQVHFLPLFVSLFFFFRTPQVKPFLKPRCWKAFPSHVLLLLFSPLFSCPRRIFYSVLGAPFPGAQHCLPPPLFFGRLHLVEFFFVLNIFTFIPQFLPPPPPPLRPHPGSIPFPISAQSPPPPFPALYRRPFFPATNKNCAPSPPPVRLRTATSSNVIVLLAQACRALEPQVGNIFFIVANLFAPPLKAFLPAHFHFLSQRSSP